MEVVRSVNGLKEQVSALQLLVDGHRICYSAFDDGSAVEWGPFQSVPCVSASQDGCTSSCYWPDWTADSSWAALELELAEPAGEFATLRAGAPAFVPESAIKSDRQNIMDKFSDGEELVFPFAADGRGATS